MDFSGDSVSQSRMRSICLGCFVMMSAKEMPELCVCGYGQTESQITNMARHRKKCSVIKSTIHKLSLENSELKKRGSDDESWKVKYMILEAKHQALIKLIKKHPPPRPAMAQNRRLRIAAGQNWECAICHMKLSSVFHIDHIQRWTDTFDDTDENLQCLCVECHTQKTSEENGA